MSRARHGGLAVGVGAFGSAVWAQREPRCHRWHLWRTRAPRAAPCRDDGGLEAGGVREPRRPLPRGSAGAMALRPPGEAC